VRNWEYKLAHSQFRTSHFIRPHIHGG